MYLAFVRLSWQFLSHSLIKTKISKFSTILTESMGQIHSLHEFI